MKFMVEFQFKPGTRNHVMDVFEQRGPNRNLGVSLRGAWIGTASDVAFVLVECADESLADKAGKAWAEHGTYNIHPVLDVDQY